MSHKDPWAMCYRDSSIAVANGAGTVPTIFLVDRLALFGNFQKNGSFGKNKAKAL